MDEEKEKEEDDGDGIDDMEEEEDGEEEREEDDVGIAKQNSSFTTPTMSRQKHFSLYLKSFLLITNQQCHMILPRYSIYSLGWRTLR